MSYGMPLLIGVSVLGSIAFLKTTSNPSAPIQTVVTPEVTPAVAPVAPAMPVVESNEEPAFELNLAGQLARTTWQKHHPKRSQLEQFKDIVRDGDDILLSRLKKNPDKYAGTDVAITGRLIEIQEEKGQTIARIEVDDDLIFMVAGNFESDFENRQKVCAIGYLAEKFSYTSQAGWNIAIPSLAATEFATPSDCAARRREAKKLLAAEPKFFGKK